MTRHRSVAAIALVALAAAAAVPLAGAVSGGAAQKVVTVTMTDYKFKLSVPSVNKGDTVTFNVVNKGKSPHDFDFAGGKGTPYIAPGKKTTLKVTFTKADRMRYVCTVPRHVQYGMSGYLPVK